MSTNTLEEILVVEDDLDIQEITKMALQDIGGYTVTMASSGAEAIQKVKEKVPQLILLDVMMPEMDGPTTLKKLRELESAKTIPVVFMTAKVQPHEIAHYKQLGSKGVITKPFDPMILPDQVNEIWSKKE